MSPRAQPRQAEAGRGRHPARHRRAAGTTAVEPSAAVDAEALIPRAARRLELDLGGGRLTLTNLDKLFWPELAITKGDLLRYYATVSPALLPHVRDRAMVMKRYPHGAAGDFFFMKRAPKPRPGFIELCSVLHGSGNVIDRPRRARPARG